VSTPVGRRHSSRSLGGVEGARGEPWTHPDRPLGGGPGCLLMILFSIVASVVLTVVLNLLAR
jgi:hypothetical protein